MGPGRIVAARFTGQSGVLTAIYFEEREGFGRERRRVAFAAREGKEDVLVDLLKRAKKAWPVAAASKLGWM